MRHAATPLTSRDHERPILTTFYPDIRSVSAMPGVYAPQHDSHLLIDAMQSTSAVPGRSVLDLCTGSGVVAIAAAQLGARSVTAFDICSQALECTRRNAAEAGVSVDARRGGCREAVRHGPYDLVVANPPYVPAGPDGHHDPGLSPAGRPVAWDAGHDGRMVLDPLCETAVDLLSDQGTLLIVQSEFARPHKTLRMLRGNRLYAEIVATQIIPFGPVLTGRAGWMEDVGLLPVGRREEELVVIRAEKP